MPNSDQQGSAGAAGPIAPTMSPMAKMGSGVDAIVGWFDPIKKMTALIMAVVSVVSGGIGYAVNYFATRDHVQEIECVLQSKIALLQFDPLRYDADIAAKTKLAGYFSDFKSQEFVLIYTNLIKEVNELKDRRIAMSDEHAKKRSDLNQICNPGKRIL